MLSQLLAAHEQLSDWAKWLVTGTRTPAVELRVFLDRALRHLPVPNRPFPIGFANDAILIDAGTAVSSDWSRGFPSLSLRYRL